MVGLDELERWKRTFVLAAIVSIQWSLSLNPKQKNQERHEEAHEIQGHDGRYILSRSRLRGGTPLEHPTIRVPLPPREQPRFFWCRSRAAAGHQQQTCANQSKDTHEYHQPPLFLLYLLLTTTKVDVVVVTVVKERSMVLCHKTTATFPTVHGRRWVTTDSHDDEYMLSYTWFSQISINQSAGDLSIIKDVCAENRILKKYWVILLH